MTIRSKVDELVNSYRDCVSMTADDLSDPERRAEICYDCDIEDSTLTEQWAIAYAIDGVAVQNSGHHADKEQRAIVRECLRRLREMGEVSSIEM